jgi:hypothetical protein
LTKSTPCVIIKVQKAKEINKMEKIIIGTRLRDGWDLDWFVIGIDNKGYTLRGERYRMTEHFTKAEIKNNFKIISR